MKRALIIFVVLVAGLSTLLYVRLRKQDIEANRPSGGSATIEGTEVDVVARLPARIKAIHVREGQAVKKGALVAELHCDDHRALVAQAEAAIQGAKVAEQAAKVGIKLAAKGAEVARSQIWAAYAAAKARQAQVLAARVQRNAAARAKQRLEKVHLAGVISDQVLDQTASKVKGLDEQIKALGATVNASNAQATTATRAGKAARIQVELAQAKALGAAVQIKMAEAARDRARTALDECKLYAPRAGYVLSRNYEPGEVALPGTRLVTLVDIREVKATFYLPNAELGAAKPGTKVVVSADAYGSKKFVGRVSRVGVNAEFTPRNVQTREDRDRLVYAVEVLVANPEGRLRPGMPVEIVIPGTRRK